jgi:adenosine deaminase
MMDKGVIVTVNSDDPAYFGGYVNQNYLVVSEALGLERQEIVAIVRNGINVSLMTAPEKDKVLADVDRVLAGST